MNPDELARYRVMAEQLRKARRLIEAQAAQIEAAEYGQETAQSGALQKENAALKDGLLASDAAFDSDNADLFEAVHRNHRTRSPFERTYYYGT